MRYQQPMLSCDYGAGCDESIVDYHAMYASSWRELMTGWQYDPCREVNGIYCPEHASKPLLARPIPPLQYPRAQPEADPGGNPDTESWDTKIARAKAIAADPEGQPDSVKLRSIADHFDAHDERDRRAGKKVSAPEVSTYLRRLAHCLADQVGRESPGL